MENGAGGCAQVPPPHPCISLQHNASPLNQSRCWRHPALPSPGAGPHYSKVTEEKSAFSRQPLPAIEINLTLPLLPHLLEQLVFCIGTPLVASGFSEKGVRKLHSSSKFGPWFGQKVISPRNNLPADIGVSLVFMAQLRMEQPLGAVHLGTKGP